MQGEQTGQVLTMQAGEQPGREWGAARAPTGWVRGLSLETVWDLVDFRKPLECLKQWDDKLCFHLTTQRREAGHRQGKGCFELLS